MRQAKEGLNGFDVGCSLLHGVFVALILVSLPLPLSSNCSEGVPGTDGGMSPQWGL